MAEKRFEKSVRVKLTPNGKVISVESTRQATDLLISVDWPGERDEWHGEAVDTCHKVLDGHRSTVDASESFARAAKAAGILVELDETVVDRSPCSQAIVLANIHDGSAVAGTEMKGVDQGMIATSAFSACYGTEQKRLADIAARKAKTMRTLGTIGRVTRAGSAVAP